jgi:hypothetical protein
MKKKISLAKMTALAELIGTLGVIVSLVFLVIGINKNTAEATADSAQAFYDSVSAVELAVASDASWVEIVVKGRNPGADLTEVERYRYDAYLTSMLDIWDGLQLRFTDGLMQEENLQDWDEYFIEWSIRHVSSATWERLKWQYDGGIAVKLERALANSSSRS